MLPNYGPQATQSQIRHIESLLSKVHSNEATSQMLHCFDTIRARAASGGFERLKGPLVIDFAKNFLFVRLAGIPRNIVEMTVMTTLGCCLLHQKDHGHVDPLHAVLYANQIWSVTGNGLGESFESVQFTYQLLYELGYVVLYKGLLTFTPTPSPDLNELLTFSAENCYEQSKGVFTAEGMTELERGLANHAPEIIRQCFGLEPRREKLHPVD